MALCRRISILEVQHLRSLEGFSNNYTFGSLDQYLPWGKKRTNMETTGDSWTEGALNSIFSPSTSLLESEK